MKIAVCDDEMLFCEQLKQNIEAFYQSLDIVVYIYQNPTKLLEKIQEDKFFFQTVFLDIEMPQMDGMQVAVQIKKLNEKLPIIFLTSHVEQMEEGFEVQAFRFLTKPLVKEKFEKALRALQKEIFDERRIQIFEGGMNYFLYEKYIICIKAENVYLKIITQDKTYLIREKMKNLEEKLDMHTFSRVHRSFLINLDWVSSYKQNTVFLQNGIKVPVSRNRRESFEEELLDYMRKKML